MNASTVYHGYNTSVVTVHLVWVLWRIFSLNAILKYNRETLGCEFWSSLHSRSPSRWLAHQHSQKQEVTALSFQKCIWAVAWHAPTHRFAELGEYYWGHTLPAVGCQEIIELEWISGSCLVQPPTLGRVPGICLILADVHPSCRDANTMALPSRLCWCSVVPTARNLLDIAWVIPSIILAHNSIPQVIKHGFKKEIILFLQENFHALEDYYWVSSQIYFLNASSSFSLYFISGCVL